MPEPRPALGGSVRDDSQRLLAICLLGLSVLLLWLARGTHGDAAPKVRLRVDPNTCPEAVLHALPRLGPMLVGRITEARAERPFRSLGDLAARVKGIGPVTAEALRPYLQFDPEADDRNARFPVGGPVSARRGPTPGDREAY